MKHTDIIDALSKIATPTQAKTIQWFFRTAEGEYAEHDQFIGVTTPELRKVANHFTDIELAELEKLLASPIHEHRSTALHILVMKYKKGNVHERERIANFYIEHLSQVNNWDLVDLSARDILGAYLFARDRSFLDELARSEDLWRRRIAIVATHFFIQHDEFQDTFRIAEIHIGDAHHLIHKATGWMLREVGKRNTLELVRFLRQHQVVMPRTMLRYAVERFPEDERTRFLVGRG